ncbi:MAG: DNA-binding protein [Lachnospiraceae bacterium]|nr:DNA-binding protein [Lachnospiraceae bacterium]MCR5267864.1 DNA-binding protein [Lachnospiraceae bacterium]
MEKIIERNLLYDFYGELLNEHQKQIYEDSAYGDLSLSELADTYEISRQGVHDLLKRCDRQLMAYEEKLHLISRFREVKALTGEIREIVKEKEPDRNEILKRTDQILELL